MHFGLKYVFSSQNASYKQKRNSGTYLDGRFLYKIDALRKNNSHSRQKKGTDLFFVTERLLLINKSVAFIVIKFNDHYAG